MSKTNRDSSRSVQERGGIIGGSSLGNFRDTPWGCRRRLAYTFLGYEPTHEKAYTPAMQLGHMFEPQMRMWACEQLHEDIVEGPFIVHPELPFLGGHPDGIYGANGIIEIKTANENSFRKLARVGIYDAYKDQLTLYMGITERYHAQFVVGCSEDISRKFITEFPWDQNRYDQIIETCVDFVCGLEDDVPARCGKRQSGLTSACRRCEFRGLCLPPALREEDYNDPV